MRSREDIEVGEELVNPEDDDSGADQYDIMRDDSCCELWTDLVKLQKFYVVKPTGHLVYYKDNPKRFWESIQSTAKFELKQLAKVSK